MSISSPGLAQSVQTRLVRHAKVIGVDPNLVLARFAAERFLYRLSRSRHAERFILNGGLMLIVWFGEEIRSTRDADLLGYGDLSAEDLTGTFGEVCGLDVEPDGLIYDAATIRVAAIRSEDLYGGQRATLQARLRVQVDVGIGDDVIPEPEWIEYPSLLDLPRPRLRAYCPETTIAEKVHAMVVLGTKNSRIKDFFDICRLANGFGFDGATLAESLRRTFQNRHTPIPMEEPIGLTSAYWGDPMRAPQIRAFARRSSVQVGPNAGVEMLALLRPFLLPILDDLRRGVSTKGKWMRGGPWR